ncbi:type I-C CRISPR-associated protein Cas8c/Csd1 [endosymbiont of Tevnia jerichonana]|uniref:type I-C CRISPR-associated protein Cas8c/Csd1 n=1 Tax=endosymbiont of Tevnia jerichonana TaxID=94785 RepID=UPI000592D623|nr:type I-C CRISPR-associated protein Cas8c/Csd1 [endosymbiont of Tevnia jerichonana]
MSWMAKLYETYEAAMQLDLDGDAKLMPISHTIQNAHIKIVIDGEGNFLRAEVLEKIPIIIPATEASAGRSGTKPPPHPLADKLQYVAKDYPKFGGKNGLILIAINNCSVSGVSLSIHTRSHKPSTVISPKERLLKI